MKRLILAVLFVFCSNVFAQVSINNTCSGTALPSGGGSDTFPWSVARPFPWTSIQGVWTVVDIEKSNLVFEFKVTRTTEKSKQLFVEIYERGNCKKAYMRGVGVVNTTEKNVVRINMNNVLMKVAMFNTADLEMDTNTCGPKSLGATFYRLADTADYEMKNEKAMINVEQSSNMILKKVSNSYLYRCKK
jgi:hypothetical protein